MRTSWRLFLLLAALALILFFGFYPIYGVNLAEPAIEWRSDGTAQVSGWNTAVADRINGPATIVGIQPGDGVLSTNGGQLRRWDFYFPWGLTPGNPSRWVLQRGAESYTAEFIYRAPSASEQARLSLRPLVALMAWAFGSLLLLRKTLSHAVAHRVGWVAIGYSIVLVAMFAKNLVTPFSFVVVGVLAPLASAAYIDLALWPDYASPVVPARRGWRSVLYGLAIALAVLSVIDAVAFQPSHALDSWTFINLETTAAGVLTLAFVIAPAILIVRAFLERKTLQRQQLRVIAWGTVLGIVPTLALILTLMRVEDVLSVFLSDVYLLTLPMIALIPLSYCYAALRHQYLDLDRFAQHAIGLIIALFATWLLYALAITIVQGVVPAPQAVLPAGLVSGLLAVTIVYQNQDQVQALTRRLLFGTSESAAMQAARLTAQFRASTSREGVVQILTEGLCKELGLSAGWLILARDGQQDAVVSWPDSLGPGAGGDLAQALQGVDASLIARPATTWPALGEPEWVRVIVPVGPHAATFRGWLLLGEKLDGTAYHARDLAVTEIVADEAAVRLDNLLHEEAARRATARQLLRELRIKRILMNMLHAAPVQYARELREELQALMVQSSVAGEALRPATEDARSLEDSLRNVMAVLGSRLLHLGLPFVLEDALDRFGATYPRIATEAHIQIPQAEAIPTLVSMVIFQGVQEALLNVARHAQAGRAVLSASHTDGRLVVGVEDDGVGLAKDFDLSTLAVQGHDGLAGLIELVRTCGGQCRLGPSSLGGLRVTLTFLDHDFQNIAEDDLIDLIASEPVFQSQPLP